MGMTKRISVAFASLLLLLNAACVDQETLKDISLGDAGGALGTAVLTNDDIVAGLKEALANGTESAINTLGQTDGFFGDSLVKIAMPDELTKIESALRALKQDRYADDFVLTMNRAAESAVPQASAVIGDAIRQMSFSDASNILNGPDDAATQYFRKVGESQLFANMLPIVQEATAQTGVTAAYKSAIGRAGAAASLLGGDALDIDKYVTNKSMDGLFLMIAKEEKQIRENPLARSSDLLKRVFGSVR